MRRLLNLVPTMVALLGCISLLPGCPPGETTNPPGPACGDGTVAVSKTPGDAVLRRQDAPRCFDMNGSIYVWKREALLEDQVVFFPSTILYEMPAERSTDVDSEFDFAIVEWLMNQRTDL